MGRKSRLTPGVQKTIVDAILAGNFLHKAAEYAGVSESTFFRWLREGESQQKGAKRNFLEAVRAAEVQVEVRAAALIQKASIDDWRAAAYFLERRYPDRWGRRNHVALSSPGGGPVRFDHGEKVTLERLRDLTTEELELLSSLQHKLADKPT